MKNFVETVVGGMVGIAALYAVGRIAYQAGHDVAELECHREQLRREMKSKEDVPDDQHDEEAPQTELVPASSLQKPTKVSMFMGLKKIFGKKDSVIGNLVNHPEAHRIEAYIVGDELRVNVKRRN